MNDRQVEILGVTFDNLTYNEYLKQLFLRMKTKQKTFVVTANPEIVMYAQKDKEYFHLLNKADLVTPDGIGIVLASKALHTPIKQRIPGFELMLGLLEMANHSKKRVFFLGGKNHVIQKTIKQIKKRWPDIEVAGFHHGYFDHKDPSYIQKIKETNPDIILVALGFPRQEVWGNNYLKEANHGLVMGVGGSFDVLSGEVKRAPEVVQSLNIEWLYRFIKEPKRYRRMFAIPSFLCSIMKEKYRNKSQK